MVLIGYVTGVPPFILNDYIFYIKVMSETKIGKIIKVSSEGWGFITSQEIPFTRIFFHWTALVQDTKKFPELRTGMKVEFIPQVHDKHGYRALKIKVIENETEVPALSE